MSEFEKLVDDLIQATQDHEKHLDGYWGSTVIRRRTNRKLHAARLAVLAAYEQKRKWAAAWKRSAKFWRRGYSWKWLLEFGTVSFKRLRKILEGEP